MVSVSTNEPDTSVAASIAAMKAVLNSADLRENLRERGLKRARHFSWQRTIELTIEAYRGDE